MEDLRGGLAGRGLCCRVGPELAVRVISMGRSRWGAELGPIGIGRGLSRASGPEPPGKVGQRDTSPNLCFFRDSGLKNH